MKKFIVFIIAAIVALILPIIIMPPLMMPFSDSRTPHWLFFFFGIIGSAAVYAIPGIILHEYGAKCFRKLWAHIPTAILTLLWSCFVGLAFCALASD